MPRTSSNVEVDAMHPRTPVLVLVSPLQAYLTPFYLCRPTTGTRRGRLKSTTRSLKGFQTSSDGENFTTLLAGCILLDDCGSLTGCMPMLPQACCAYRVSAALELLHLDVRQAQSLCTELPGHTLECWQKAERVSPSIQIAPSSLP